MGVRREKRRPSLASRLIGPLIVLLAVAVWPAAVFAADATTDAPSNGIVVFVVVLLLLGSVTAGLFFASPFRKRITSSAMEQEEADDALEAPTRRSVYSPLIPVQAAPAQPMPDYPALVQRTVITQRIVPDEQTMLAQGTMPAQRIMPVQPAPVQLPMPVKPSPAELSIPAPPAPVQPPPARQPRPIGSPWSTGAPQPDTNWQPGRQRTP